MADNNPEVLHVQFSDDGAHIRRWAREPFDGSSAFTRAPAVSEEAVERVAIRRDVFDFLMGTGALGGYYFGESRPDMRGAFWWRTIMRATLSPTTPTEEPQS